MNKHKIREFIENVMSQKGKGILIKDSNGFSTVILSDMNSALEQLIGFHGKEITLTVWNTVYAVHPLDGKQAFWEAAGHVTYDLVSDPNEYTVCEFSVIDKA